MIENITKLEGIIMATRSEKKEIIEKYRLFVQKRIVSIVSVAIKMIKDANHSDMIGILEDLAHRKKEVISGIIKSKSVYDRILSYEQRESVVLIEVDERLDYDFFNKESNELLKKALINRIVKHSLGSIEDHFKRNSSIESKQLTQIVGEKGDQIFKLNPGIEELLGKESWINMIVEACKDVRLEIQKYFMSASAV